MHNLPFFLTAVITFFFILISIFSLLPIIAYLLWGSEKNKKLVRPKDERTFQPSEKKSLISKLCTGRISSRALSRVKKISWRKTLQAEGEEEDHGDYDHDNEEAIWRKPILRGKHCRPLDFSGDTDSDSDGLDPLTDLPRQRRRNHEAASLETSRNLLGW